MTMQQNSGFNSIRTRSLAVVYLAASSAAATSMNSKCGVMVSTGLAGTEMGASSENLTDIPWWSSSMFYNKTALDAVNQGNMKIDNHAVGQMHVHFPGHEEYDGHYPTLDRTLINQLDQGLDLFFTGNFQCTNTVPPGYFEKNGAKNGSYWAVMQDIHNNLTAYNKIAELVSPSILPETMDLKGINDVINGYQEKIFTTCNETANVTCPTYVGALVTGCDVKLAEDTIDHYIAFAQKHGVYVVVQQMFVGFPTGFSGVIANETGLFGESCPNITTNGPGSPIVGVKEFMTATVTKLLSAPEVYKFAWMDQGHWDTSSFDLHPELLTHYKELCAEVPTSETTTGAPPSETPTAAPAASSSTALAGLFAVMLTGMVVAW